MLIMRLLCVATVLVIATGTLAAQYSQESRALKKYSELFDERGIDRARTANIDGRLAITPNNGNVTYSYPIASRTMHGFPMNVRLNYCGSVAFTAFTEYSDRTITSPYGRWSRFHQNRPAWIIGVNGFAVQVLSNTTNYHASPSRIPSFGPTRTQYNDADLLWTVDGYDVCNRMEDIVAGGASTYVDVIRLLRDDGSVLELVNARRANATSPGNRPDIFAGSYFVNEANAKGYGVVEFDSTYWGAYLRRFATGLRFIPRRLRYYPGDGLEYLFREWIVPYGIHDYADSMLRFGGMLAGPTIFYLEEIRSNGSIIAAATRSRQVPVWEAYASRASSDSSKGRALFTGLSGVCGVLYGKRSLTIEAVGRTTKVYFDKVVPSGEGTSSEYLPLAQFGYDNAWSRALATCTQSQMPYKSHVGYVTRIVDPEGRITDFDYEGYIRRFQGFGFPTPGADATLSLANLRLCSIHEPTCIYRICYQTGDVRNTIMGSPCSSAGDDQRLISGVSSGDNPSALSNMVATLERFEIDSTLLATDAFAWADYDYTLGGFETAIQTTTDALSGTTRTTRIRTRRHALTPVVPFAPSPIFTELRSVEESDGTTTTVSSFLYGTPTPSNVLWLPLEATLTVNGIRKNMQRFSYLSDTVRRYGDDAALTSTFGREVTRRVTFNFSGSTNVRTIDTTTWSHFPAMSTLVTRVDSTWLKIPTLRNFLRKKYEDGDPLLVDKEWESVLFDPIVAVYRIDTLTELVTRSPEFGVEQRTVTADPSGRVLAGIARRLNGNANPNDRWNSPGAVLEDTVIGRDGDSRVTATYQLGGAWMRNHVVAERNANGAAHLSSYDGWLIAPRRIGPDSSFQLPTAGLILTDDDSLLKEPLDGVSPVLLEEPVAELQLVRRATPSGAIVTDTLMQEMERSWFGQISALRDENGWLSRYRYDKNGRLLYAWSPGDYPRESHRTEYYYEGADSIELYGNTRYVRRIDTLRCGILRRDSLEYPRSIATGAGPLITTEYGTLYAGRPVLKRPLCPCGNDDGSIAAEKPTGQLLRTCNDTAEFEVLGGYPGYVGELFFRVDSASVFRILQRLDSAWLRFYVANVEGSCVSATVSIPRFGFRKSFLFNCPTTGETQVESAREHRPALQGDETPRRSAVEQGPYLIVRLDSVLPEVAALATGDTFGISIGVSTAGGALRFAAGTDAVDIRPKLFVFGRYRSISDTADFTAAYRHDDQNLTTDLIAKTDDNAHTSSAWTVNRYHPDVRRSQMRNVFGAGFRHRWSEILIGEPQVPERRDTIAFSYTGLGLRKSVRDQGGDETTITFDGLDRPVDQKSPDGSHLGMRYSVGNPASFGLGSDQDFEGFCTRTEVVDEEGNVRIRFTDARDLLRREVVAAGRLDLTTQFDYDELGRLAIAVNPNGDTTRYSYDAFGRVRTKYHPDLGTVSMAYDAVGNLRLTQSEQQARDGVLTFNEYDDLNRVTLIGEAGVAGAVGPLRLTDRIDGARMHHGMANDTLVTVNPSLWLPILGRAVPRVWDYSMQRTMPQVCTMGPNVFLRENTAPVPPLLAHPIAYHEPIVQPLATEADFENTARYPHFVRTVIAYDTLPQRAGWLWSLMPSREQWDSIAPRGRVRNGRGREVAIAYREHGGEPFHFSMLSYDERGRVEALLRYTENVGFDAVYYTYNSLDLVTSVRVADPLNQHTTWYGYHQNGRVDTVWTLLERGRGLGLGRPTRPRMPARPSAPDIVYVYTRSGHVATMSYPQVSTEVAYAYSNRKWIDSIVTLRQSPGVPSVLLFKQVLLHDRTGQVLEQRWFNGGLAEQVQRYSYDPAGRLANVIDAQGATQYVLDRVSNRHLMVSPSSRTEYRYALSGARDQLATTIDRDLRGWHRTDYGYDADGAVTSRRRTDSTSLGLTVGPLETFTWSYRELLRRFTSNGMQHDWRYRYSPAGEREQKRLYPQNQQDPGASGENPWIYYLLGAGGEQLAEWHGRENYRPECSGSPIGSVCLYPVAYNSQGGGLTRVATRPDVAVAQGRKEYFVQDYLGSTRLVIDAVGSVVDRVDYDPFGAPVRMPVSRQTYAGREMDLEALLGDFGVRKYEPSEGRFFSVDPLWEGQRDISPYHYAHADPINNVDPDGRWDIVIHVAKDRSQNGYGVAVVTDRNGEEVYRFIVRVEGVGNPRRYGSEVNPRDRMQNSADTPLGVYDIPDGNAKWITGKSRTAYGPNARLRMDPLSGEIVKSKRSAIRIHGGRQEEYSKGRYVKKTNAKLEKTHGCIRAYDNALKQLKETVDALERNDAQEHGGTVTIVDDLDPNAPTVAASKDINTENGSH